MKNYANRVVPWSLLCVSVDQVTVKDLFSAAKFQFLLIKLELCVTHFATQFQGKVEKISSFLTLINFFLLLSNHFCFVFVGVAHKSVKVGDEKTSNAVNSSDQIFVYISIKAKKNICERSLSYSPIIIHSLGIVLNSNLN